jgi:hypothetical protein
MLGGGHEKGEGEVLCVGGQEWGDWHRCGEEGKKREREKGCGDEGRKMAGK